MWRQTSLVSRVCVLHGSRLGVQMVTFLSRLRGTTVLRVCVEKGWGLPHHSLIMPFLRATSTSPHGLGAKLKTNHPLRLQWLNEASGVQLNSSALRLKTGSYDHELKEL